jgi:hypothetical protein
MANPTLLTMPLCQNADKNTIPPTDAGTSGLFSEELGFQDINSLPLASGGKAPNRRDFNGVFALLGGIAYACQRGYTFEWDSTQDYVVGCVVLDTNDNKRYECISDVTANATPPSNDTTHWKEFGADMTVLANTDLSNLTATGLNAFATKTLSNLDTSNLTYHLVVDSYHNNTTGDWYRVYDDGWVEQGGNLGATSGYQTVNVNLLKPMADNFYYVGVARDSATEYAPSLGTLTTTVLQIIKLYCNGHGRWCVCGMGASV